MRKKRKKQLAGTDIEIEIVGEQNTYDATLTTQDGVIVGVPERLKSGKEVEIEIGDKVHTHHFLADEDNVVDYGDGEFFKLTYNDIYCKEKDGELVAINEWLICEGVFEEKKSASGLILTSAPVRNQHKMVVVAIGPYGEAECGAKKGDTVQLFSEPQGSGNYELMINGKMHYRVRAKDIAGVWQETE